MRATNLYLLPAYIFWLALHCKLYVTSSELLARKGRLQQRRGQTKTVDSMMDEVASRDHTQ